MRRDWATRKRAVISKSLLSAAALRYYFISERTITNRVRTPHIRANIFDVENVVSDQEEEEDQLPQNLHLHLNETATGALIRVASICKTQMCEWVDRNGESAYLVVYVARTIMHYVGGA